MFKNIFNAINTKKISQGKIKENFEFLKKVEDSRNPQGFKGTRHLCYIHFNTYLILKSKKIH